MFIPIILGTAREGAESNKVADFVLAEADKFGFETKLIRVEDYTEGRTKRLIDGGKKAEIWAKIVEKSGGFIIVLPEYNYSFPGELKMFLDSLFKEYFGKCVGLCGLSSGGFGGVRAVEHLKPILVKFRMKIAGSSVYFSNVKELFGEEGGIADRSYEEKLKVLFEEMEKLCFLSQRKK